MRGRVEGAVFTLFLVFQVLLCFVTLGRQLSCYFVALLFYVHGKHLRSCRDGQLT